MRGPNRNVPVDPVDPVEKTGDSGIIWTVKRSVRMNLQLFAEKNISKQSSLALRKGAQSLQKRIAEHKEYIENPKVHVPDWDSLPQNRRDGLIRHWNKEIANFSKSYNDRIKILHERGEQYE